MAIDGLWIGKMRSTPTPAETFRTVKFSLIPPPRFAITMPSNACTRSLSRSRTRNMTRIVSPGSPTRRLISTTAGSCGLRNTTTSPRAGRPTGNSRVFTTGRRGP